jgi:glycerol-3-phosphate dehydrogenase
LRLVKGSHLVVKKLFTHDFAYIFQNTDRRITFAIPYETDFTLIGTTDVNHQGEIGTVAMDEAECAYICEQVGRYFCQAITPADVIWSYSGVRPLLDDASGNPSAVTRDYRLDLDTELAPLLSVWGGKITTYRKLAEQASAMLAPTLSNQASAWTDKAPLPGGDLGPGATLSQHPAQDFDNFVVASRSRYGWLPPDLCLRYARAYGTRLDALLRGANCMTDLGALIAPQLYERELQYLVKHEWARQSDDVLWRRTKLGLHMTPSERQAVEQWFTDKGVRE